MIVLIIQDKGVAVSKLEGHSPVAIHRNRPSTAHIPLKRVESKPWDVHVLDGVCRIQGGQLHPQPFGMIGLDARSNAGFEKLSQAFVSERLDHPKKISCCALRNKGLTDFMRVLGIPLLAPDLAMKSGQFSCEGAKAEGPQFDPHSHDHQDCLVEVEDGGDSGGGKVGEVVGGVPAAWGAGGLGV